MIDEWLGALPNELAPQQAVMRGLIEQAKANDRIRVVVVGCSIGRGNADAFSDIDAYVGVLDDDWRNSLTEIDAGLDLLASVWPDVARGQSMPPFGERVRAQLSALR